MNDQPSSLTADRAESLGQLVSEHSFSVLQLVVGAILFTALGALGAYWLFQGLTHTGKPDGHSGYDMVKWLGAAILVVDVALIARAFVGFSRRIELYRDGFVSYSFGGPEAFRWSDIESVHQRSVAYSVNFAPVAKFQSFTVRRKDGKRIDLNSNLEGVSKLGKVVLSETYAVLAPRCQKRLEQGEAVPFGAVSISAVGLRWRRWLLTWADFTGVDFSDGQMRVRGRKGWTWCRVPVKRVANLHVLLSLIGDRQPH